MTMVRCSSSLGSRPPAQRRPRPCLPGLELRRQVRPASGLEASSENPTARGAGQDSGLTRTRRAVPSAPALGLCRLGSSFCTSLPAGLSRPWIGVEEREIGLSSKCALRNAAKPAGNAANPCPQPLQPFLRRPTLSCRAPPAALRFMGSLEDPTVTASAAKVTRKDLVAATPWLELISIS